MVWRGGASAKVAEMDEIMLLSFVFLSALPAIPLLLLASAILVIADLITGFRYSKEIESIRSRITWPIFMISYLVSLVLMSLYFL